MTDVITEDPVRTIGTRVHVHSATFRGMVSPPSVRDRVGLWGDIIAVDNGDDTVRVRFDDGPSYWLDPSGLDTDGSAPPTDPTEFHVGDEVVIESNLLPDYVEGALGSNIIGIRGRVTAIHGGDEITGCGHRLHRDSFVKVDDLDRLAEERSIVGKRVRIVLPEVDPGSTDVMIEPVVGEIGTVTEGPAADRSSLLVGGLSSGHTDGHSLYVGLHAIEIVEDEAVPHSGAEPEPTITYAEAAAMLLDLDETAVGEPMATVVRDLRDMHLQIESLVESAQSERAAWEDRMERLQERAREVADEESWCGVFDRAMDTLGLQRRTRKMEVGWRWSQVVTVSYSVDDDTAASIIADGLGISSDDVEIPGYNRIEGEVTLNASGMYEADEGECVCDQIDEEHIRSNLTYNEREVIDDNSEEIDLEGVTCDNCN